MTTTDQQRALRRRRRRERQAVVFGSLIAGLAVAGLGAAATYTGALDLPFLEREFASPAPEAGASTSPPPCPAEGTLPVPYTDVQVTVLNGAGIAGLAGQVQGDLASRGFTVLGTGNFPTSLPGTAQIMFGAQGVAAAYTLAAHLTDPVLVLDLREDATVDLVLGEAFDVPVPLESVALDPETPLTPVEGCVPLEEALTTAVPAPAPPEDEAAEDGATDEGAEEDAATEG
ncbi:LytR C-terminal domain-containing protein [Cellulomonas sp. APG4]|uniref:LytR C-terminal domain-containing protein n=1 Tax=Cellulomonas sp. APG4 TaxID=1538656 RepID=UPI0013798951|nr:LytR C-terminal domain-containing protein [Cellulomonas sp. APG4]NCT92349.1 LytR C-terminal domain-containing protein [Cellulomonas sp. APG4]